MRSPHSLAASFAACSGVSPWVTPTRTSNPGSSMAPATSHPPPHSPCVVTLARLTRCTTARIARQGTRSVAPAGKGQTAGMTIVTEHQGVNPVVAEVVRSGFTESRHRGAVAGLAADGTQVISAGNTAVPFFPRSSNKPMQAVAMLRCGLDLDGELLALAAASHSGEDFHVTGARKILAGAGLTEDALQCPPDLPLDEDARAAVLLAGGQPGRLYMNCSGKRGHARHLR